MIVVYSLFLKVDYKVLLSTRKELKKMEEKRKKLEQWLIDTMTATEEEIDLIYSINGQTLESVEDILYSRTGYRSLDQIIGEKEEEEEDYE